MIGPRPAAVALGLAGSWLLTTAPQTLVTVAQGDAFRSPRAARTSDVSADGRTVVFESQARLVPADTDDSPDIYVLDRLSGHVTLESGALDGDHTHPRISGDGRVVVFETRPPSAMVTPRADIALHDRVDGTTRLLTKTARNTDPYGWSRNPDISDDGQVVAFSSAATTLTAGLDMNGAVEDVYVVRLPGGTISRVSLSARGAQLARGDSILPSLSADGRWVAFASTAALDEDSAGTAAAAGRRYRQVFLRDTVEGRTIRVAPAARRGLPNADSSVPSMSGDGRYVTFVSDASNLLDDDRNDAADVFLYDRESATLTWVSRGADGSPAAGESIAPVISASGRFVAFQSDAANLVCARRCVEHTDDINLIWDVFVFDRTTRQIVRISEDELGGWTEPSAGPSLDATGSVAAFSSRQPADAADTARDFDLFVRALSVAPVITRRAPE
jgi:Tol biopolymer transport system component